MCAAARLPLVVCLVTTPLVIAQEPAGHPHLSCSEMEQFMRQAKIGAQRTTSKGVTAPHKALLDDGKVQHSAAIQIVDESKSRFESTRGVEINFRDYWGFNVAGYELAKLIQFNMVPPYIARKVAGNSAALSWWIDNVAFDEGERQRRKVPIPDSTTWNQEMYALRVFNELIYNTDANLTNILITKDWHIWIIDFTRAFRMQKMLQNPKNLVKCDRTMLANLRKLDKPLLEKTLRPYLRGTEIDGVLARRDLIVRFFDQEVAKKGEAAVLFDLPRNTQPCGTGI